MGGKGAKGPPEKSKLEGKDKKIVWHMCKRLKRERMGRFPRVETRTIRGLFDDRTSPPFSPFAALELDETWKLWVSDCPSPPAPPFPTHHEIREKMANSCAFRRRQGVQTNDAKANPNPVLVKTHTR